MRHARSQRVAQQEERTHIPAGENYDRLRRFRVGTEVTFGRGDLSVCPQGAFWGPMNLLFLIGGVSPRGPHRDKH